MDKDDKKMTSDKMQNTTVCGSKDMPKIKQVASTSPCVGTTPSWKMTPMKKGKY